MTLRQSVVFPCHLLNFGSCTKGACSNWDNLKWRLEITPVTAARPVSCSQDCKRARRTQTGSRVTLHKLSVLGSRQLTGRCPTYCRIWVGPGWCRQGAA